MVSSDTYACMQVHGELPDHADGGSDRGPSQCIGQVTLLFMIT